MGSSQRWEVGQRVSVGGHKAPYIVMAVLPPRQPGEAKRYELANGDGSKAYHWIPYRGLRLVRGDLVRDRRKEHRAKKAAKVSLVQDLPRAQPPQAVPTVYPAPQPQAQMVPRGGLWSRLAQGLGLRKPTSDVTITRPSGATIDHRAGH